MRWLRFGILGLFISGVAVQAEAPAGIPFSTLCQTSGGICAVSSAPVGSSCVCGRDRDRGKIIIPPPNMSNACGTRRGVCRVDYGRTGSPCACAADQGERIKSK
jgi:hypothetical protein